MTMKYNNIKTLIDKYLDGMTTNDEERLLRNYFGNLNNKIPEEWNVYRALFSYEVNQSQPTDISVKTMSLRSSNKIQSIRKYFITAAACAAIALILALSIPDKKQNYAIIDGKKYTNPEIINKQAEAALENVSTNDEETFAALAE